MYHLFLTVKTAKYQLKQLIFLQRTVEDGVFSQTIILQDNSWTEYLIKVKKVLIKNM